MSDPGIQRIKALAHPLRAEIIRVLNREQEPVSIRRVSQVLDEKPTKLHYHFRLLEAAGYIEVAATREIHGITERFYRTTGEDLDIILRLERDAEAVMELIPMMEHRALEIIRRIPALRGAVNPTFLGTIRDIRFTPEAAVGARQALNDFLEHRTARLPEQAEDDAGDEYELMLFLVPRPKNTT